MQIEVTVRDKIARTANKHDFAVCGNSDYTIKFDFDSEWDAYETKTARFKWNGSYTDVVFSDSECPMPIITNAFRVEIGVYAGELHTTTSASLPLRKSILCGDEIEIESSLVGSNEIISAIEEANEEQIQSVTEIVDSGYDKLLAAINQAVFDKQLLVDILAGTCENLTGDAITMIADYCFYYNETLRSVDLPNCIRVGHQAFHGCENIESLKIPMLFSVDALAFCDCNSLLSVDFPNLTKTVEHTFSSCRKLVSANLPALNVIDTSMFNGCQSLKEIICPNVQSIGSYAFYGCKSLEEISFSQVNEIGSNAFDECNVLRSIDLPKVETIDAECFNGCYSLEFINAPLMKTINNYGFGSCKSLRSIDVSNVTYVGSNAFAQCIALTEVNFEQLTTLSYTAFYRCTSLKKVFLPKTVQNIWALRSNSSPFYGCTNSEFQIFCEATEQPSGWGDYWNYCGQSETVTVHWGATREEYEAY